MKYFSTWLLKQLDQRGWSQATLAERMGKARSTVSAVITGRNQPSLDFCHKLGKALGLPVIDVFRATGYLPDIEDGDYIELLSDLITSMEERDKQDILDYIQFRMKHPITK